MTMTRIPAAIAISTVALLALAGCGGGNDSTSGGAYGGGGETTAESASGGAYGGGGETTAEPASSSPTQAPAAVVAVAPVPKLGKLIVNSGGFTLYNFHKDKGTTSSCYGACASFWPPLITEGSPKAEGVPAGMLGTTKRNDGTVQVTFAGHPIYTFSEDKKPGEANGNDFKAFGGEWYALMPNGQEP
jgi:predicted lipoprotein with Yx(FWY)xxD motif